MVAQRLSAIELYVTDRDGAVEYFTTLGLAPLDRPAAAPDRVSTTLTSGAATVIVTAPTSDGGEVREHLDRHGDGIAVLTLACENVEVTYERALAAGARADGPRGLRVPGLEPVRHVLEPLTGENAPADVAPTHPSAIDHLALCVRAGELKTLAEFYQRGLGLEEYFSEFFEVGAQAMDTLVVRSLSGGLTLTMVEPVAGREPGQLDRFVAAHDGPGVQHVALLVEDIVTAKRAAGAGAGGVRFLDAPDAYYDVVADRDAEVVADLSLLRGTGILVDTDEFGELLQIFTASPYPRGTLFYELIERREARSFGTRNIRALYEAVERVESQAGVTPR